MPSFKQLVKASISLVYFPGTLRVQHPRVDVSDQHFPGPSRNIQGLRRWVRGVIYAKLVWQVKDVTESYDCCAGLTISRICISKEDPHTMATAQDVEESYGRFVFFRLWSGEHVVKGTEDTCSESLFLIPMFASD